jgi:hypothetical protein
VDRGKYGPIPVKVVFVATELVQVEQVSLLGRWPFAFVLSGMFLEQRIALCDPLEQPLSQAEQSRRGLLEAVLQEALAGRLDAKEESHADIA